MANSKVDRDEKQMFVEHGTKCLITDPIADKYLQKAKAKQYSIPEDRYSRPCGGAGGFDDFVERMHE